MTKLVLVRHGETVWHAENRYAGITDIALNQRGFEQAEALGRWAGTARLDALWVSPLMRARDTATPAARTTGLTARIDPRLSEVDFGIVEGLTIAEMEQRLPAEFAAFKADPVAGCFPGGENPIAAADRAIACFRDIAQAHPAGRVLVVMHNTLLRAALCRLIGVPVSRYRTLFPHVPNTTLTEIAFDGQTMALLQFNTPIATP